MVIIGQWILFSLVVLLGLILLWFAAKYILKLAIVIAIAILIIYALHRFELLPDQAQKYIDELVSQESVQKAKDWFRQWSGGEEENVPPDEGNTSS